MNRLKTNVTVTHVEPPPQETTVERPPGCTIWIGNLPVGTKAIDVRELVSLYGKVHQKDIIFFLSLKAFVERLKVMSFKMNR